MKENKQVWNADLGDGTYRNPILYADYSDPDAIRVGDDYFMVASSFCNTPALPLLHSKDLVNWRVVNYVLDKIPYSDYDVPAHGRGVWAPAIRYHDDKFWVFYPMPDEGIFCCTAVDPFGKWSEPFPVREGKGWIDPCPLWDDDGKAYMVSAFAKSRIGFKSILNVAPMKPDCTGLLDDGRHVFDGHNTQPTIEGPKLYKRNSYYYIFAPAGGVKHGWQTVLRSKSIWGPYEEKVVMYRGSTSVNGPHQGALVDTPSGENWFLHFQDVGVAGRIVHLQPVQWVNDWPVIGDDSGGEGCGQPVMEYKKPDVGGVFDPVYPADSDEFDGPALGLQWQWNANYREEWYSLENSRLRLFGQNYTGSLNDMPHLLLQKFMAPEFQAVARLDFSDLKAGDTVGFMALGGVYGALAIHKAAEGIELVAYRGVQKGGEDRTVIASANLTGELYLKLTVRNSTECEFFYGIDGKAFLSSGLKFTTTPGAWVGAKFGLFVTGSGSASSDWVRVEPVAD